MAILTGAASPVVFAGLVPQAIAELAPSAVAGAVSSAVPEAGSSTNLAEVAFLVDRIVSATSRERIRLSHGSGGGARNGSVEVASSFEKTDGVPSHVRPQRIRIIQWQLKKSIESGTENPVERGIMLDF